LMSAFLLLVVASWARGEERTEYKFCFGDGDVPAGFVGVQPENIYSTELGYGFEAGDLVRSGKGFVTGNKPFYFSVALPEGNYLVTLTLGDAGGESTTTVKAELRRLMLENVHTHSGESRGTAGGRC
jgi:hypothetical protein